MQQQDNNMAPGQQNYPSTNKEENNKNTLPDEEIRAGAQQDDQLDKFKQDAPEGEEGERIGSQPSAYKAPNERGEENKRKQ
jgi:hypothetical protein